jgi:uncharacterized protein (DUF433 family)
MSELARITARPDQCAGRPCMRGLRVRVKDILDLLAAGASREEIFEDFPYLEPADINAALGSPRGRLSTRSSAWPDAFPGRGTGSACPARWIADNPCEPRFERLLSTLTDMRPLAAIRDSR